MGIQKISYIQYVENELFYLIDLYNKNPNKEIEKKINQLQMIYVKFLAI